MGTNYYLMTRNKDFVRKHFADEYGNYITGEDYSIVDEPYLGYEIHLNKLSCGWRPLFHRHKPFKTWNELEKFCHDYKDEIEIFDEYGRSYSFDDYKKIIFDHATREPEPIKWVYDYDPIDAILHKNSGRKTMHTEICEPEEADLWIPIDHVKYFKTEEAAKKKFKVYSYYIFEGIEYWNDPDYPIDWTEGDFS